MTTQLIILAIILAAAWTVYKLCDRSAPECLAEDFDRRDTRIEDRPPTRYTVRTEAVPSAVNSTLPLRATRDLITEHSANPLAGINAGSLARTISE